MRTEVEECSLSSFTSDGLRQASSSIEYTMAGQGFYNALASHRSGIPAYFGFDGLSTKPLGSC